MATDERTYRVRHETTYHYGARMTDGYTVTCLVPRPTEVQQVDEVEDVVLHGVDVQLHPADQ